MLSKSGSGTPKQITLKHGEARLSKAGLSQGTVRQGKTREGRTGKTEERKGRN